MARPRKPSKREPRKPGWRRLRRVGDTPIRCRDESCRRDLGRGDLVYWMPCVLRGQEITGHAGFYWCETCGQAIYQRVEHPPARAVRNPGGQ